MKMEESGLDEDMDRDDEDTWKEDSLPPSPSPPVLRKPQMSLSYRQAWRGRHNHFNSHSDVRPKEHKRRTVNEIANQKLALQKVNGWKVSSRFVLHQWSRNSFSGPFRGGHSGVLVQVSWTYDINVLLK